MSCQEELFHIADIYRTVEMEAYDYLGRTIVLVRCVFPPGIKYAHLVPDREIPHETYTLEQAFKNITRLADSKNTPIHFINDDPALHMQGLLHALVSEGYKVILNTYGFFPIADQVLDNLTSLYLITRPGMYLLLSLLYRATEIRAYWKPGDSTINEHAECVWQLCHTASAADRFVLVPYSPDLETIQRTIDQAMLWGCRVGLHPASILPDVDKHLQGNPASEEVIHQMQREVIAKAGSITTLGRVLPGIVVSVFSRGRGKKR